MTDKRNPILSVIPVTARFTIPYPYSAFYGDLVVVQPPGKLTLAASDPDLKKILYSKHVDGS